MQRLLHSFEKKIIMMAVCLIYSQKQYGIVVLTKKISTQYLANCSLSIYIDVVVKT